MGNIIAFFQTDDILLLSKIKLNSLCRALITVSFFNTSAGKLSIPVDFPSLFRKTTLLI